MYDLECSVCEYSFEALVSPDEQILCPECSGPSRILLSAVRVGHYNDPAKRSAALKLRSKEHSIKNMKQNWDKLGFESDKLSKWNVRDSKNRKKKTKN